MVVVLVLGVEAVAEGVEREIEEVLVSDTRACFNALKRSLRSLRACFSAVSRCTFCFKNVCRCSLLVKLPPHRSHPLTAASSYSSLH